MNQITWLSPSFSFIIGPITLLSKAVLILKNNLYCEMLVIIDFKFIKIYLFYWKLFFCYSIFYFTCYDEIIIKSTTKRVNIFYHQQFGCYLFSKIGKFSQKSVVAGSDSHTLLRLGSCYTLGEGRNRNEFLDSLRNGRVQIAGPHGRFTDIFNDAMGVYLSYFRDIAFRNEVHRNWSSLKKIRNGTGWAAYLPVFLTLSFAYSIVYYRMEDRKHAYYERLLLKLAEGDAS